MYQEWPFFQSTIDLIEMILAKADMRIAELYDQQLVADPSQRALGATIRDRFMTTVQSILQVPIHLLSVSQSITPFPATQGCSDV